MALIKERWSINKYFNAPERPFTIPVANDFEKFLLQPDNIVECGLGPNNISVLKPSLTKKEESRARRIPVKEYTEQERIRRSARIQKNL